MGKQSGIADSESFAVETNISMSTVEINNRKNGRNQPKTNQKEPTLEEMLEGITTKKNLHTEVDFGKRKARSFYKWHTLPKAAMPSGSISTHKPDTNKPDDVPPSSYPRHATTKRSA